MQTNLFTTMTRINEGSSFKSDTTECNIGFDTNAVDEEFNECLKEEFDAFNSEGVNHAIKNNEETLMISNVNPEGTLTDTEEEIARLDNDNIEYDKKIEKEIARLDNDNIEYDKKIEEENKKDSEENNKEEQLISIDVKENTDGCAINTISSIYFKNDEIGEKNIDSVKYSLDSYQSMASDNMTLNISNIRSINENAITTEGNIEDVPELLEGDYELTNNEMTFNKIMKDTNTETGMETEDIDANQKEIFKQIKNGINGNSANRSMQIMLKPHHLGKVNLNLKFFNNAMHINVFVENGNVEELLRNNIGQIINSIDPSGAINVGSLSISKIEDIQGKNTRENSKNEDGYKKNKSNPFVQKIRKNNYYR